MESPHITSGPKKSKRLLVLTIPFALFMMVALGVVFSARRAISRASQATAIEGQLAFTLRTLDASSNLARGLGFETVASAPSYTTGWSFLGDLYLGGASGVVVLHADGAPPLNLRAGFELPVAPISSIGSGRPRGTTQPQLLLATGGAGLLLLEPGSGGNLTIRQLLPADVEDRNLTALLLRNVPGKNG